MSNYYSKLSGKKTEEQDIEKEKMIENLRNRISTELAVQTAGMNLFGTSDKEVIRKVARWINEIIEKSDVSLPIYEQRKLTEEMIYDITSLGKIHHLMMDVSVSEVMVNAPDEVWIERSGKLELTNIKFKDNNEVTDLARKITAYVNRRVDNSNPIVDARLPDGSRVHIVIPPIALKGTTITIRKFFKEKLGIQDLIKFGTISPLGAKFIEAAVISRANVVVSGGTGSGKTTTLNIVSNFVPIGERIITIEDSAELQLSNPHVVKMEARQKNQEGEGEVSIRNLVAASLRMRPDRVIIGEIRDGAAFDMLQAMNTGHDGSATTVHSNNPDLCVSRLANLILQTGFELPDRAIKEIITEAVDIIIQITRLKDGSRKITHIAEVERFDTETGKVHTRNIFEWRQTGIKEGKLLGEMVYTGYTPTEGLLEKFEKHGENFFHLVEGEVR